MKKSVFKSLILMTIAFAFIIIATLSLVFILNGPKLNGLILDTSAVQKEFIEGNDFNYDGLKVYARYEDGSKKKVEKYTVDNSSFDNESVGSYTITVNYKKHIKTYDVKVFYKDITKLSVESLPKFFIGQTLQASDLIVKVHFNNGDNKVLTDYTVDNFDSSVEGDVVAKVSYAGFSLDFTANVLSNTEYIDYALNNLIETGKVSTIQQKTEGNHHNHLYISDDILYYNTDAQEIIVENGSEYLHDKEMDIKLKTSRTIEEMLYELYDITYDKALNNATNYYVTTLTLLKGSLKQTGELKFVHNNGELKITFTDSMMYGVVTIKNGYITDISQNINGETFDTTLEYNQSIEIPQYNPDDYRLVV